MPRLLFAFTLFAFTALFALIWVGDARAQTTRCQPTISHPCPPAPDRNANAPQPYKLPELGKLKEIPDTPPPPIMSLPDGATVGFGNGGVGLERKF
jgi:hypothetical protein